MLKYFPFLFWSPINYIYTRFFRLFTRFLPERLKIVVKGKFKLKLDNEKSIYFNTNYTSWHGRLLFWNGFKGYEHEVTSVFAKIIPHCNSFLDIGSNIGYYSLIAEKLNSNIKTHAFEPLPDAIHYINLNIESNNFKNVQIHDIALSDKKGETTFESRVSKDFPNEKYQIAGDSSLINYDDTKRKQIRVKTETLDNYFPTLNLSSIDYIKIDTETTEHIILSKGLETIKKHLPIIQCEVLKGFNESELQKIIQPMGYQFFLMTNNGLVLKNSLSEIENEKNDFLFVPVSKIEFLKEISVL